MQRDLAVMATAHASLLTARRLASKLTSFSHGARGVRQVHVGRKREVHATGIRGYSNDYIHAETMYNLTAMTNRKMKFGALVWGGVLAGTVIPLIAVSFQQAKARGG